VLPTPTPTRRTELLFRRRIFIDSRTYYSQRRWPRLAFSRRMSKCAKRHASCRSFAARSRRPSAPTRVDLPGPPLDEPITPIGPARQVGVVGRDQEGDAALGLEPCEQIVNNLASLRVEVARGLVGQDQRGTIDEGACDRDPLLLAARQLARAAVHPVGQADLGERRRGQLPRLRGGLPWRERWGPGVLTRGQLAEPVG